MMVDVERLVEVDSKRRVVLGKLGRPEHTRYIARDEEDGTIVLEPAVVMTENEARLMTDAAVARALAERSDGVPAPEWLVEDLDRVVAEDQAERG